MIKRSTVLVLAFALAGAPALADSLVGAEAFLCATGQAVMCPVDEDCEYGSAFVFNIPQFIEVDLAAKKLRTTRASAEPRETPILNMHRAEGLIVLQGFERGRAFSFVIDEASGEITAAVARRGIAVAVYGACTPQPAADAPAAARR